MPYLYIVWWDGLGRPHLETGNVIHLKKTKTYTVETEVIKEPARLVHMNTSSETVWENKVKQNSNLLNLR